MLIYYFPFRAFITYQQLSSWLLEGRGGGEGAGRDEVEGTEILEQSVDRAQLEKLGIVFYSVYKL